MKIMKKLFALSLAALMVMSLATVAFAAAGDGAAKATQLEFTPKAPAATSVKAVAAMSLKGYLENTDGVVLITGDKGDEMVAPGKTVYFPLSNKAPMTTPIDDAEFVVLSDAIKSVSTSTKYTLGQDLVDSIKIVYKKTDVNNAYGYMLAVTFKSSTSTAAKDFAAEVTLKKSSGTDNTATDAKKELGFTGKWRITTTVKFGTGDIAKVTSGYKVFDFKDKAEEVFEFEKFEGVTFEVDVTGQDKMLIKADAKYDATVAGKYPAANINFFNGYGATFNKIGELRLPAEPGSYLYAINADGTLKAVAAEYDDGLEAFVIKTRTLGHYAISDTELEIAPVVEVPAEEPEAPVVETPETPKPNVNTGAAA
jgi:hypothetical protein